MPAIGHVLLCFRFLLLSETYRIAGYFEALNFHGLLKFKHFADFIFEDRGSFDHNPTVSNDFEALHFRGSRSTSKTARSSCLENNPLYGNYCLIIQYLRLRCSARPRSDYQ